MGRVAFVISLVINAGLLGFLAIAIIATYFVDPGEEQIGLGIVWFVSLPAVALFSVFALAAYRRYVSCGSRARLSLYACLVVSISVLAPLATLAVFRVLQWAAA